MDIEHTLVHDDPRTWSYARKTATLVIVSSIAMTAGLGTSIQNPANAQIEQDLHVSSSDVSWSISLFVLVQGTFQLVWSVISEIIGRKIVYISSLSLFVVGSACAATSNSIGLLMAMRVLQAIGTSVAMSIAAATLADIYEPHERGTKMGIYYAAPLLGVSIGPFLGGVLAQAFGWRAVFWFMLVVGGVNLVSLVFLKDTFRKERSLAYRKAHRRNLEQRQPSAVAPSQIDTVESAVDESQHIMMPPQKTIEGPEPKTLHSLRGDGITLSFMDVNPFPLIIVALKQLNNDIIFLAASLMFGFTSSLMYTCAITLSTWYGYEALYTGLVLLCYGVGSVCGSILGGRWSDRTLGRLANQYGQATFAEMRLQSTYPAMLGFPLSAIGYAWVCQTHQVVGAICVMLFSCGFCLGWMYSSTLAYIVDANVGRSSTAVAANTACRGILAFTAVEIAVPLQNSIGDGGLYTLWAGLLVIVDILVLAVFKFGKGWRERGEPQAEKQSSAITV